MPNLLTQVIELLTRSPADLVYNLIVLFAIEAILGLAIVGGRRTGWSRQLKLIALAGGVMLLGRIALIGVALVTLQSTSADAALAAAIIPPLERYLDVLNLIFLAWAFVPWLREQLQLGVGLVGVNVVAATIFYAASAAQWYNLSAVPNVFYNGSQADIIWQAWQIALAGLCAAGVWLGRDEAAGLSFMPFLILAVGGVLQIVAAVPSSNVAGWTRLAQLIAYPLFAVLVYQITEAAVPTRAAVPASHLLPPTQPETADQAWLVLATIQNLNMATDLPDALQRVAAALTQFMKADLAAFGLIGKAPNTIELVALHYAERGVMPMRNTRLRLAQQPTLNRALDNHQTIVIGSGNSPTEIIELYGLMGSFVTGPLLIAPLSSDGATLGVLLLGNPTSGRAWTKIDVDHAETLTGQMSLMLTARDNRQRFIQRIQELETLLHQQETEATQRRTTLESLLQQSQAEAQKTATRLAALVALQEAQSMQHSAEREQIEQLTQERARLEQQAQEYQAELSQLIQLQTTLDIQLKQAQQDISRVQDQAGRTPAITSTQNNHQQEIMASLVQELRTPMTSITGYTDLLLGESAGILGAMQRQFLQRVKTNIARMEGMLADLLQITAIDAGQIKFEPAPIDVAEMIKDAVMSSATLFRERDQSIRLELAENMPRLHTDRERIQQVLLHLLSNASQCSPNQAEVVVRAQVPVEMPDYMLFSVTDQGGGIAPEDRLRAFHRMYRADHPLVQGLGETGVGLSIVKALIEAQGGRIWVDGEMGVGSTFTFILPLKPEPVELE